MPNKPKTFYETQIDKLFQDVLFRPDQYRQVRQSKMIMDKSYAENITLDHLAAAAFMSRFHFVRIFQKMYGLTPMNYLRDLRIAKAKKLLVRGVPVTQVCFDVGYQSLPTFSSVFKKCTSYSPKRYQQLNALHSPHKSTAQNL